MGESESGEAGADTGARTGSSSGGDAEGTSTLESPKLKRRSVNDLGFSPAAVAVLVANGIDFADQIGRAKDLSPMIGMTTGHLTSIHKNLKKIGINMDLDGLDPDVAATIDPDYGLTLKRSRSQELAMKLEAARPDLPTPWPDLSAKIPNGRERR